MKIWLGKLDFPHGILTILPPDHYFLAQISLFCLQITIFQVWFLHFLFPQITFGASKLILWDQYCFPKLLLVLPKWLSGITIFWVCYFDCLAAHSRIIEINIFTPPWLWLTNNSYFWRIHILKIIGPLAKIWELRPLVLSPKTCK